MTGARGKSKTRAKWAHGFTLIEVLIAFTILSLALSALFGAFSSGLSASLRAGDISHLTLSGRSIISQVGASIDLVPGETRGEWDDGLNWALTVEETQPLEQAPISRLAVAAYRVELTIEGDEGQTLRLSTLKLGAVSQ